MTHAFDPTDDEILTLAASIPPEAFDRLLARYKDGPTDLSPLPSRTHSATSEACHVGWRYRWPNRETGRIARTNGADGDGAPRRPGAAGPPKKGNRNLDCEDS